MKERDAMTRALELAAEYDAGTAKCIASGYGEFGPEFQRDRKLISDALRQYGAALSPQTRWTAQDIAEAETEASALHAYFHPAPPAPGADSWQPIETAPRDGTKIDLLFAYPRGRQNDCQWRQGGVYGDGGWIWLIPQWGSQPGLGIDWHLLPEEEWEVGSYPHMEPTHWMIPPALPRAEGGVGS